MLISKYFTETILIMNRTYCFINLLYSCPGSVMFAFRYPNNEVILHTGDFRATPEMESHPIFWECEVTDLYLDTTYLTSKYSLMSQEACINKCLDETQLFMEKHIGERILIVCGAYVIGKIL